MNDTTNTRHYSVSQLLNVFPDVIINEILADGDFCKKHAIFTESQFTFNSDEISFSSKVLFDAIRQGYKDVNNPIMVKSESGVYWELSVEKPHLNSGYHVRFQQEQTVFYSTMFWPLSNDPVERVVTFQGEAALRNLLQSDSDKWTKRLQLDDH